MPDEQTARIGYARDPDLNYEALVVLEEESGETLEVQRALSFDDQDTALGIDTYCLVSGAGATYYGGVESWDVEDGLFTLTLRDEAATVLDLPSDVVISVRAADEATLREHLMRIVGQG